MKTFTVLAALLAASVSVSASPLEAVPSKAIERRDPDAAATSSLPKPYASGWCGVHVKQYQRNEPKSNPGPNYLLDITIFDAAKNRIGGVHRAEAPAFQGVAVPSLLPWMLIVTTEQRDEDPVLFDYAGQHWAYADVAHACNFGAFDKGDRDGDCGFTC